MTTSAPDDETKTPPLERAKTTGTQWQTTIQRSQTYANQVGDACGVLDGIYRHFLPRVPAADRMRDFRLAFLHPVQSSLTTLLAPGKFTSASLTAMARLYVILTDPRPVDPLLAAPRANSKIMKEHGEVIRTESDKAAVAWKQLRECARWEKVSLPELADLYKDIRKSLDDVFSGRTRILSRKRKGPVTDAKKTATKTMVTKRKRGTTNKKEEDPTARRETVDLTT